MNLYLRVKTIVLIFFSCINNPHPIFAQSTPPSGVTIPPNTPGKVEQTIPQSTSSPIYTPPSPSNLILFPNPTENPLDIIPTGESFFVKEIQIIGNTVLKEEITKLKRSLENKYIRFEQLLELRSQITQRYIKKGYITSGAFLLNNQNLNSGIVKIQIVEGELEAVEVSGLQRLQEGYVCSRIARATQIPFNQKRLEQALQLLQIDPLIAQVKAELTAGSTPGRNILRLQLKEAPAFHAGMEVANSQSSSIGSEQGSVFIEHENVLGFGDKFYAEYGITKGLNLYDFSYNVPFNALDGTIGVRYNNSDSKIIEDDFRDLNIRSKSRTFSFNIRQPLQCTPNSEFALGLAFDLRRSQTFLLDDIPFSFSEGPEEGESKVTAIRFSQDWLQRDANRVLAARSQFNIGIGAFDATVNDTGTDGRFLTWLGQFQWVQKLSPRTIIVAKIDAQLTGDSLLSLEKFSIGGVETVRGYNQNQVVTDNGIIASIEARIPLTSNTNILQLVPFFDFGTG
ncbi:MAG: ShlB/FhaC/HecB family hemolysin secretion/activation protein [Nostoc sp. DedSLP03]|nr:ShlB/FhaC/HecB family hemolysin secretion/activation protein [Nostoc sp. DedSLP03]MDZ7968066.1 ShlB/FhaC/HecB family hemolysin secretion/activation protein [Nostoc sp. DedSLP03]